MATIDEIAERAARDVRADVRNVIDVDAGLRAIVGGSARATGSPRRAWWVAGWAVAAAAVVLAVFLVVRDDSAGTVVPATTPPDLSTELTTESTVSESTVSESTVETTTGSSTPTSVVAASCDEASLLAAVAATLPDVSTAQFTSVTVDACRGGFARVVAIADQSTCPTLGQECYENQPFWFHDVGGVWTFLDSGTGISCSPGETSPPIEPACAAFAAVDVTLRLPADAPVVTATAVPGGEFDGGVAAMSSNGNILVSKLDGDDARLYWFTYGDALIDTGVVVAQGTALWFAPDGDLFAVEHINGLGTARITRFERALDRLVRRESISGPITGECGFAVEPGFIGCPTGTGPQMPFDPPIEFDRVTGDPLLAGVDGRGVVVRQGAVAKQWTVGLDATAPIDCTDDGCMGQWLPGPDGSAVYLPYLEVPEGGNHLAAFVVSDQPTVDGVRLEGLDVAIGLVGTQVYGVQYGGGGQRLVVVDLSPYLP